MRLRTVHHRPTPTPTPHGRFLPLEYSRLQGAGRGKCSVSDLLSNFCGSLADQIDSRKYFYKSATLVREVPPLPAGTFPRAPHCCVLACAVLHCAPLMERVSDRPARASQQMRRCL